MSVLIKTDKEYAIWINEIKNQFKQSQIKAASMVNSEMLLLYWKIGSDIVEKKMLSGYGSNFYDTLSNDLKAYLPEIKSFSPRNLRYMTDFYETYKDIENVKQFEVARNNENLQQLVANLQMPNIFQIPWGHHILILTKCKENKNKALFYVNQTLKNKWSRATLLNFLDTDLYEREGKAITNFETALPALDSDLAREIEQELKN